MRTIRVGFFDRTSKMWNDKKRLWLSIPNLAVVGVSDWITNEAKKSPMFKNAKIIRRIYNWIDLDVFKPANADDIREKYGLTDKKNNSRCLKRMEPKERARYFLKGCRLPQK